MARTETLLKLRVSHNHNSTKTQVAMTHKHWSRSTARRDAPLTRATALPVPAYSTSKLDRKERRWKKLRHYRVSLHKPEHADTERHFMSSIKVGNVEGS